jgi:hypothetical protein
MWKPSLLFMILIFVCAFNEGTTYNGPQYLGLFHIDRITSLETLFNNLGHPTSIKSDCFCYQSPDKDTFLWINRMAHEPKQVGDVLLSSFPNCIGKSIQITSNNVINWKTDRGIGLGSTVESVHEAYGKPSRQDVIKDNDYRWIIAGKIPANEIFPPRGDSVLVYTGAENDLNTAEFGIQKEKVIWIYLSCNE